MGAIKLFMGYILAFLRVLILILSMFLVVSFGILLKVTGLLPMKFAFLIRTYYCRFAQKVLGIRSQTTGVLDMEPGLLYVSNHRSMIDPIVLFSYIKNGYGISKAELQHYPLIGLGAGLSGVVYVQRSDSKSRSATKSAIIETLQRHDSILLFPEGTISLSKNILPFRKGGFEACIESHSKIVPIAIEYMNPMRDYWYTDHIFMQFLVTFSKWRTDVCIHFFEEHSHQDPVILCKEVSTQIQSKLHEFQKNWKEKDIPESLRLEVQ